MSSSWPAFPTYNDPLRHWRNLAGPRVALVDRARDIRLTYRDMDRECDRWASLLRGQGVGRGERVAVIAGNRSEVAELFFACTRVGAALVPLNWRLAPLELGAILDHAQAKLVIGESRFRAALEAGSGSDIGRWLDIDDDAPKLLASASSSGDDVDLGPEDHALILYTSGSTGQPKGVIIPQRQILFNAVATTTAWELDHSDIAPVATPFFHTGGWNVFATPLWHRGGTVVLFDQFDPSAFIDAIADEHCTVALTVPTQLVMMSQAASWGKDLPDLRYFISGGAPCSGALAAQVRAAGYTLREGYGLTECGPNCFAISNEESLRNPGKVGRPVPFLEMRLVSEGGDDVADGEPGELLLRGPQMFGGYLHDADRTAEALAPGGWLRTGDLAMRGADGLYAICGRRKEMYISGGENVFPGEVESALTGHPAIAEAVVVGVPHSVWGEVGCAFILTRVGHTAPTSEEVVAFARKNLAGYKVPRSVVVLDEFPRLGSGKADRRALGARAPSPETPARLSVAKAKGSPLIATVEFIRVEKGEEALERVLARLEPDDRKVITGSKPTDEVPLDLAIRLWRAADEELRDEEPGWVERAGGFSIEVPGVRMYSGLLRKASPTEFLTQRVSLFRLYYHPGNMEVVEEEEEHAVLRLVGFDQADPLFCRRQTGGLRRALTEAGGQEPLASHVRCVVEGDAFCEWELRWR